jgi:nucleoside-diphosphate-sugar epimerase
MTKRIAVFGGAGYVGLHLCRLLTKRGHHVLIVGRGNRGFLLDGIDVEITSLEKLEEAGADVVINLAYPSKGSFINHSRDNGELNRSVQRAARRADRLIHTSTLAVFGMALDQPVTRGRVAMRRDEAYVETKLEFEHLLLRDIVSSRHLDIVRLGNVWGPGSPGWTATLAERLLFGQPVGMRGQDGFSNVTDVANAADYLCFLAERPGGNGESFHHLAELGDIPWSHWVNAMAAAMKCEPVIAEATSTAAGSLWADLRGTVGSLNVGGAVSSLYGSRYGGSLIRSVLRTLPGGVVSQLKRLKGARGAPRSDRRSSAEDGFLRVLAAPRRFESVVDAAWKPPLDSEASLKGVLQWLKDVGYASGGRKGISR